MCIRDRYEKLVFTVCFQMVRDYQEAQNLSQETFLSAFRNIDVYKRQLETFTGSVANLVVFSSSPS